MIHLRRPRTPTGATTSSRQCCVLQENYCEFFFFLSLSRCRSTHDVRYIQPCTKIVTLTIEHAIVLEHGFQAASTATAIARATLIEAVFESDVVQRPLLDVHGSVRTLVLFSIKTHWQHLLRFPGSPLLPADSVRHHVCDPCVPKELIDLLFLSVATLGPEMVTGPEREHFCKILVFFVNKFDENFTIQQDGLA